MPTPKYSVEWIESINVDKLPASDAVSSQDWNEFCEHELSLQDAVKKYAKDYSISPRDGTVTIKK